MFRGKKYQDSAKQIDKALQYDPKEGLELICKTASAKFDETVELHVKLGVGLVALGEDQHAGGLTGAVGQDDGAADLLVSVAGVDTQLHMQLDGLVELGLGGLGDELEGFLRLVLSLLINELSALFIIFTSEQFSFLLIKWFVGWMILPRSGSGI